MSGPVRRIQGFYEVESAFAVPVTYAHDILKASLYVVGEYVGPLALESMTGVRVNTPADPIRAKGLRINSGPHAAFLTRRQFESKTEGSVAYGITLATEAPGLASKIFVHDFKDPTATIIAGIHEIAHSFGLDHCVDSSCIMQPRLDEPDPHMLKTPFCDNCAGDLELTRYSALATQL